MRKETEVARRIKGGNERGGRQRPAPGPQLLIIIRRNKEIRESWA